MPTIRNPLTRLPPGLREVSSRLAHAGWLTLGEPSSFAATRPRSSGSLRLDCALGLRGLPHGRVVELFGAPGTGKTTLALQAIATAQAVGGLCAFVDAERALHRPHAEALGVDPATLLVARPGGAEQALRLCEYLLALRGTHLVVVDSVAALLADNDEPRPGDSPGNAPGGSPGDSLLRLREDGSAGALRVAMRRLALAASRGSCTLLLTNQLRHAPDPASRGSRERTAGGDVVRFHATVRLHLHAVSELPAETMPPSKGMRVRATVRKHGLLPATCGTVATLQLRHAAGFCEFDDLIAQGLATGVLQRRGATLAWHATDLGSSASAARVILEQRPSLVALLRAAILAAAQMQRAP